MWGVSEAFKIVEKTTRQVQEPWVINIFCDSQSIIHNLRECNVNAGQALKLQIYQKAQKLVERGHSIFISWVPGHSAVEGNERADKAAKEAALGRRVRTANWTFLTHIKRQITEEKKSQISIWHGQKTMERERNRRVFYIPSIKPQIHPVLCIPVLPTEDWTWCYRDFLEADRSGRVSRMLVAREQRAICPTSIYKLSKVEERTPSFEEKFGKGWDAVAKTTRKEMASRADS